MPPSLLRGGANVLKDLPPSHVILQTEGYQAWLSLVLLGSCGRSALVERWKIAFIQEVKKCLLAKPVALTTRHQ